MRYPEGSVIIIPAGVASGHKARSLTATTQLFLVEEVQ
jgi:quercetin dioxygenase-like cupin family protein